MLDRRKLKWSQEQPHILTSHFEWKRKEARNWLMPCMFGHSVGRDNEKKTNFALSVPFNWLYSPGSCWYHVGMTCWKCFWSLSRRKKCGKENFYSVCYLNLGCISDPSGVFFLPQNCQTLSLLVDYRQLVAVVQTKVSLCQSISFSALCKAIPFIIFDTHS